MNTDIIRSLLAGDNISTGEMVENNKSSEKYLKVTFVQDNGFSWETYVPFYSRWSALYLEDEREIADYVRSLKTYFTEENMKKWKATEWKKWKSNQGGVTKYFFKKLLSFKGEFQFRIPGGSLSDNPARRIQDIKDKGYTVASVMRKTGGVQKTFRYLLPIPLNNRLGYETFSPQLKSRIIRLLNGINAFEARPTSKSGLIPDHKFSEIRWDDETKEENLMSMTDDEIVAKFQLLDNQRNLQKREICRKCFQEDVRGTIYGIKYFYKGSDRWDKDIPKTGKAAEAGCEGCPWYDIDAWRKRINEKLESHEN